MYSTRYPVGSPLTDQQSVELMGWRSCRPWSSRIEGQRRRHCTCMRREMCRGRCDTPGLPTVQGWLNCEAELKVLRFGGTPDFRDPAVIARIRTGLRHALPTSAPLELDFALRTET